MFNDATEQLASAPHFGALGQLLRRPPDEVIFKREYVERTAAKLLAVKQAKPGTGLSADRNFPQGPDGRWVGLGDWTGLDICQAWAVLLNAGHLFGTFASERALLFQLDRDLGFRDRFIEGVTQYDRNRGNSFRPRAEDLIDRAMLHSFHYLLALSRLRDGGPSNLDESERSKAARLIVAFVDPPTPKIANLAHLFRRARQLTYLAMHTQLADEHRLVDGTRLEDDLAALFPLDAILGGDFVDAGSRWDVLKAVDRLEADEMFNSRRAAAAVLTHLKEFTSWWNMRASSGSDPLTLVDQLYTRPDDWPTLPHAALEHYGKLYLSTRVGWLHEVRLWRRDDAQADPWGDSTFLVTPMPHDDDALVVDLYAPPAGLSIATTKHLIRQVSHALSVAHGQESRKKLWMTVARLIATLFTGCLKPGYRLRLTPVPGRNGRVGYGTVASTYELARGIVKRFIVDCKDDQRAIELRQLLSVADGDGIWRTRTLVLMAKTEVLDAGGRTVTDIDGLVGKFQENTLRWTIVETKKSGSDNPEEQLNARANEYLSTPRSNSTLTTINAQRVAWFTTESPARVLPPASTELDADIEEPAQHQPAGDESS